MTRWTCSLAVFVATGLLASARAHAWPGENALGTADTTIHVEASDDRYPFCSTIDVATARTVAVKRFPKVRSAIVAASGRAMEILAKAGDAAAGTYVCYELDLDPRTGVQGAHDESNRSRPTKLRRWLSRFV